MSTPVGLHDFLERQPVVAYVSIYIYSLFIVFLMYIYTIFFPFLSAGRVSSIARSKSGDQACESQGKGRQPQRKKRNGNCCSIPGAGHFTVQKEGWGLHLSNYWYLLHEKSRVNSVHVCI